MPTLEHVLAVQVAITAIGFGGFTLLICARAWWKVGPPCWPLQVHWVVAILFFSIAARFSDLTIARWTGTPLNAPHTVLEWAVMDVAVCWVTWRTLRRKLFLEERDPKLPPGVGYDRRQRVRRNGYGRRKADRP